MVNVFDLRLLFFHVPDDIPDKVIVIMQMLFSVTEKLIGLGLEKLTT